jgi:hypothetical protein
MIGNSEFFILKEGQKEGWFYSSALKRIISASISPKLGELIFI